MAPDKERAQGKDENGHEEVGTHPKIPGKSLVLEKMFSLNSFFGRGYFPRSSVFLVPLRLAEEKFVISFPAGLLQKAPLTRAFRGPAGDEIVRLGYSGVFLSWPMAF